MMERDNGRRKVKGMGDDGRREVMDMGVDGRGDDGDGR